MSATYPHLTGDLDTSPDLMKRLDKLAASRGQVFTITSGGRTFGEQAALYARRATNRYPVAKPSLGDPHINYGHPIAADVTVNGTPIQQAVPAKDLMKAGITPLAGDAVHVQLAAKPAIKVGPVSAATGIGPVDSAIGTVTGVLGDAGSAVSGAVADAGVAAAKATAGAVVDALGLDGGRIVTYVALVALATVFVVVGISRATGLKLPKPSPEMVALGAL